MSHTTPNQPVSLKSSTTHIRKPHSNPNTSRTIFWLVLIAIVLLSANMRSPFVALGSIAPVVQDALNISEWHIGWLGSVPMIMFALGALLSPSIAKRFGIENTLIMALIVLTFGLILRTVWVSWSGFLTGTLLLSFAIGFANTLAAPVIKQRTPNNIPLITGLFSLTMAVMAGIAAAVVYPMTERVGWQWALGSWAILGIAAIIAWVILRLKLGSSHKLPSSMDASSSEIADEISVWRSPLAWQIAIFMGLQSLLFYVVASFMPSIWISKGLSQVEGGNMGSIFQLVAPATVIGITWFIRSGHSIQKIAVISALLNVIGVFGMTYLSASLAWLWSIFMGIGCAGIFTLMMILFSIRSYTPIQASKLSGMAQTIAYLVAFTGPFGAGWLHEQTHGWDTPLMFILILTALNVVMAWFATRPIMVDGRPAH